MALARRRQVVVVGAGAAAGSFVASLLRARRATSTPSAPLEVLVFEKDLATDSESYESHDETQGGYSDGRGSQGRRAWLGWAWSTGAEFHRSNVPTQSMEYVRSSYAAPRPHHRIRSSSPFPSSSLTPSSRSLYFSLPPSIVEEEGHFRRWVAAGRDAGTVGLEFGEGGDWHVPRGVYGQYIRDTVEHELALELKEAGEAGEAGTGLGPGGTTVRVVRGEVVAVDTVNTVKQTPTVSAEEGAEGEGGNLRVEVVLSSSDNSDSSNSSSSSSSNSSSGDSSSGDSSSGTRSVIHPDHVILCTGNLPPAGLPFPGSDAFFASQPGRYLSNPWPVIDSLDEWLQVRELHCMIRIQVCKCASDQVWATTRVLARTPDRRDSSPFTLTPPDT